MKGSQDHAAKLAPREVLLARYARLAAGGISGAHPVALILANIDHFEAVNLEIGALAADEVLSEFQAILVRSGNGPVARIGGDLFAMLRLDDLANVRRKAEALRREIADATYPGGVALTASLGVAATDRPASFDDLFSHAEACLQAAKAKGRNCVGGDAKFAAASALDEDVSNNDDKKRTPTDRVSAALKLRGRKIAVGLKTEAERDSLTGLFNRHYFDRRLEREFEAAHASSARLSLVLLDLDYFGNINRAYGLPTGDETLKMFSDMVRCSIRQTDWAARYGGEQFCVVLPGATALGAHALAGRLRSSLQERRIRSHDGRTFTVTASQGVAEIATSDRSPVDLVQRANDRLRQAKNAGRDRICA